MPSARMKDSSVRKLPLLNKTSTESVDGTFTPELVIVLCGPIGSPLHKVAENIEKILRDSYRYECKSIRLSKIIEEYGSKVAENTANNSHQFHHVRGLIKRGDELREKYGNRILADLAIKEIAQFREPIAKL